MPTIQSSESCVICSVSESVMHSHHTVPQSRGGKDSLQIILCSGCHNILHANANYIVSRQRNPNRPAKEFWKSVDTRRQAEPWLQILVQAMVTPNAEMAAITDHLVSTPLNGSDFQLFKLLAQDLGCSQEKAVEYCIRYVLHKRGFKHEKIKPELWFLPVSRP
jgi:hypothetical protein